MDCERSLNLISARLDREITPDDLAWLEAHLAGCADCRAAAESFALQHDELRQEFAPRRAAAAATAATAVTVTAAKAPPLPSTPGLVQRIIAIAALVLLFVGVFLYNRYRHPAQLTRPPDDPAFTFGDPVPGPSPGPAPFLPALTPRARPVAPPPTVLAVGTPVKTLPGERRRLALPDHSVLYVDQDTDLTLESEQVLHVRKGAVYVESSPEAQGLLVTTPARNVASAGRFAVRALTNRTDVLVTLGNAHVSNVSAPWEGDVQAGQFLPGSATRSESAPRASYLLDWTRDLMAAAEMSLVPASRYAGGSLLAVDAAGQEARLSLRRCTVDVHIEDGFARTTIDQTYFNHHPFRLEGTFFFPLPADASLSRLAMYVNGDLMEGSMAERDYARSVYQRIVNNQRDPALLEWVDGTTFKMRVFPLEGRQEKRIVLSYTQRLPTLYGRTTYRFPSGHSLQTVGQWRFRATVKGGKGQGLVSSSPTHPRLHPVDAFPVEVGLQEEATTPADLRLFDEARDVKADRDVVVELQEPAAAAGPARFASAEHDGSTYLMLRYRPELPGQPTRQRRDWVFLFEASADRDPLLARTQVDLVRHLLANANSDDTFMVLTANSRVHAYHPDPLPVTPGNVAGALKFLERTHLVGALDLGNALVEADKALKRGSNPHLVHLGSGLTALGVRQERLLGHLPACPYVGVGVGKRWGRDWMKQAAEKTGGHFTQVNPDEPVAWRAFELMATLDTPRLLEAAVETEGGASLPFLTETTTVCQGEELFAVARLTGPPPAALVVRGRVNGADFRQVLPVVDVRGGAGYLPRTWAKLEIARLLADRKDHKDEVIALSKAMYVMTPYTSLLVLENEAMYAEFKVDRGRKDHWAMYDLRAKIPVKDPEYDPTMPADVRNAPKGLKPAPSTVAQSVIVRVPAQFIGSADGFVKPLPTSGVVQLVFTDSEVQNYSIGFKAGVIGYRGLNNMGVAQNIPPQQEIKDLIARQERLSLRMGREDRERLQSDQERLYRETLDIIAPGQTKSLGVKGGSHLSSTNTSIDFNFGAVDPRSDHIFREFDGFRAGRNVYFDGPDSTGLERRRFLVGEQRLTATFDVNGIRGRPDDSDIGLIPVSGIRNQVILRDRVEFSPHGRLLSATPAEAGLFSSALPGNQVLPKDRPAPGLLYWKEDPTWDDRLFSDLLAYAPGLNTSAADQRAVLEAEAAPDLRSAPGHIDPDAKALLDGARTGGWQQRTLPGGVVLRFDGAGRYAFSRTLSTGLREQVICDGVTLWHLYPELGLASRRTVSRFHRADLAALLPWLAPHAEDLARGADVTLSDPNTVAVVPHLPEDADAQKPAKTYQLRLVFADGRLAERRLVELPGDKVLSRVAYDGHGGSRVFGADGKERAAVSVPLQPAEAPDLVPETADLVVLPLPLRSREHVFERLNLNPQQSLNTEENAWCRCLDRESATELLAALMAVHNTDEARTLFRTCFVSHGDQRIGLYVILAAAGVDVSAEPAFQYHLTGQTTPLARYLMLVTGNADAWLQRQGFHPGTTTTTADGWLRSTLLGASGSLARSDDPLKRLAATALERSAPPGDFLHQLAELRDLTQRWDAPSTLWRPMVRPDDLRRSLAYILAHRHSASGRMLLLQMQKNEHSPAHWRALAAAWGVLGQDGDYQARYEQACCLLEAGDRAAARARFLTLYEDTLAAGVVPPLDRRCRQALEEEDATKDAWAPLLRGTAQRLVKAKNRPAALALASQAWDLGDPLLSENILTIALSGDMEKAERDEAAVAAVDYLMRTKQLARAETRVNELLGSHADAPALWRLAANLAEQRGHRARAITCLEKALDLEYAHLPEVIALDGWRRDYGQLLAWYHEQARTTDNRAELAARTLRAIDRWRAHDPEPGDGPQTAAATLLLLGQPDLAWDYCTTPFAGNAGAERSPEALAANLVREGNYDLAERAYAVSCAAAPTNGQLTWERAQALRQAGKADEADRLLKDLVENKDVDAPLRARVRWQLEQGPKR